MKKLLNDPAASVDEALDGLCVAHPSLGDKTVLDPLEADAMEAEAGRQYSPRCHGAARAA